MSFDEDVMNFHSEMNEKINTTPEIVTETFNYGQKLLNHDYLPEIKNVKLVKKYLKGFTEINLFKLGYTFGFHSSKQVVGLCEVKPEDGKTLKAISASIQFTKHDENRQKNFVDVIKHEIVHGIINTIFEGRRSELERIDEIEKVTQGHGIVFRAIGKAIKCSLLFQYKTAKLKDSFKDYRYQCTYCGHIEYGSWPAFTDECSVCNKPVTIDMNKV